MIFRTRPTSISRAKPTWPTPALLATIVKFLIPARLNLQSVQWLTYAAKAANQNDGAISNAL